MPSYITVDKLKAALAIAVKGNGPWAILDPVADTISCFLTPSTGIIANIHGDWRGDPLTTRHVYQPAKLTKVLNCFAKGELIAISDTGAITGTKNTAEFDIADDDIIADVAMPDITLTWEEEFQCSADGLDLKPYLHVGANVRDIREPLRGIVFRNGAMYSTNGKTMATRKIDFRLADGVKHAIIHGDCVPVLQTMIAGGGDFVLESLARANQDDDFTNVVRICSNGGIIYTSRVCGKPPDINLVLDGVLDKCIMTTINIPALKDALKNMDVILTDTFDHVVKLEFIPDGSTMVSATLDKSVAKKNIPGNGNFTLSFAEPITKHFNSGMLSDCIAFIQDMYGKNGHTACPIGVTPSSMAIMFPDEHTQVVVMPVVPGADGTGVINRTHY